LAEQSFWFTTNGTGDGSATGYTQVDLSVIGRVLAACHGFEGVAPRYLNACAPSSTGANNCRIASGGAMVDGKPYNNTDNVDVTIPSATAGNTRIDRVVLRADWSAQTVRVTRIAGVDSGSPSAPAIVQTSGTTYDITLARVTVTDAGAITLVDERVMAAMFTHYQGGSSTRWDTPGTANAVVNGVRMVAGTAEMTFAAEPSKSVNITFPSGWFDYEPLVIAVAATDAFGVVVTVKAASDPLQSTLYAITRTGDNYTGTIEVNWIALGYKG
jgi:hypothetical protein